MLRSGSSRGPAEAGRVSAVVKLAIIFYAVRQHTGFPRGPAPGGRDKGQSPFGQQPGPYGAGAGMGGLGGGAGGWNTGPGNIATGFARNKMPSHHHYLSTLILK